MTFTHAKRYNETVKSDPDWSKNQKTIHPKNMDGCQYGRLHVLDGEDKNNYIENVPSGIYECNNGCQCSQNCSNRITQKGVTTHLEAKYEGDDKGGWTVYSRETIPAGTFIFLYLGEVLKEAVNKLNVSRTIDKFKGEVDRKKKEFFLDNKTFEIKHNQVNVKSLGLKTYDDEQNDYLVVNAFKKGNVARFANHRCGEYNMISQPVYRNSHSVNFFYNALFTRREITPMWPLTWDYGYDDEGLTNYLKCNCLTEECPNNK